MRVSVRKRPLSGGYDLEEELGAPDDEGVADEFAYCHGNEYDPFVGSHESERYYDGAAEHRDETEEGHPRATSADEAFCPVKFLLADVSISFYPFRITESAEPVAGHAARHVAGQRPPQAREGVEVQRPNASHKYGFRAERDDATGNK